MEDNYLDVFKNLFFDIDVNKDVKNTISQANYVLASIITKFGEIENEVSLGISQQDGFVDTVVCLFVRKIMEQLDAMNVLFSVCSLRQAQIILRSLIENIISLEFILKEDTAKRAAAYFLEHHYQEIELGKDCFDEKSVYRELLIKSKGQEQFDNDYEKYKKKQEAFERLVSSKEIFQEVDNARTQKLLKKKRQAKKMHKKKVFIQWYEVCSTVSSFYSLMKVAGYEQYYQGIYGGLSFETHALNSTMDMNFCNDEMRLNWIRNPEGGGSTFSLACTFSLSALLAIYKYLNDGDEEQKEFASFFMDFKEKRDITSHNLDMIKSSANSIA